AIVSLTRHAFGDPNTGLAPSSTSSTRARSDWMSLDGRTDKPPGRIAGSCGMNDMPPAASTLPSTLLSALTASAWNRLFVYASGGAAATPHAAARQRDVRYA